jgi:hypothetical protein
MFRVSFLRLIVCCIAVTSLFPLYAPENTLSRRQVCCGSIPLTPATGYIFMLLGLGLTTVSYRQRTCSSWTPRQERLLITGATFSFVGLTGLLGHLLYQCFSCSPCGRKHKENGEEMRTQDLNV